MDSITRTVTESLPREKPLGGSGNHKNRPSPNPLPPSSMPVAVAHAGRFVVTSQADLGRPVLVAKIFHFTRRANHLYKFAPSHPTRGAYRDRHGRGVGCGGRGSIRRAT